MLKTRLITALIALPIVIGAIYLGGVWFFGGTVIIAAIAAWEFTRMMKAGGYEAVPLITIALTVLLIADSFYASLRLLSLIISVALLVSLVWQLFRHTSTPTANWALSLAGGLYIGWGMGHIVALRELADGLYWLWLALLCTWASDTFAYFAGRAFGGRLVERKLWPRHSPKKTWEGLLGGIAGSMLVAVIFALAAPGINWLSALVVGAIIPVAGLLGDLSVSMMKRDVGVKDSSNLFPGHGGFLDRLDSILFVGIVVYYYAIWIG